MECEDLPKCNLGIMLNDDCHKKLLLRKTGFKQMSTLSREDCTLLCLGSCVSQDELHQVCRHHEEMYLSTYESHQRFCAVPRNIHQENFS